MTDDLFDDNAGDQGQIDPSKNYLEELVGEGKKFKTPQELARGKAESDAYIKLMERRFDEMRDEYKQLKDAHDSGPRLQELIDQLSKQQLASSDNTNRANEVNNVQANQVDLKDIDARIASKVQEMDLTKKQQENYNTVMQRLKEQFGSNYQSVLSQKAEELELSKEEVNSLAKKSPKAFFNTLGLNETEKETFQPPVRGSQRSDNFVPKGPQKRTWSYYQDIKQKDPVLYLNPKTQNQMQKDYIALGDEFEDGNFKAFN